MFHPCPCCDLGGMDDAPCPSRVEIDEARAALDTLEAQVHAEETPHRTRMRIAEHALKGIAAIIGKLDMYEADAGWSAVSDIEKLLPPGLATTSAKTSGSEQRGKAFPGESALGTNTMPAGGPEEAGTISTDDRGAGK